MKKYQTIKVKDKVYILVFYKFKRRKAFFYVLNDLGDLLCDNGLCFSAALRFCKQTYHRTENPHISTMVDNFIEYTKEQ